MTDYAATIETKAPAEAVLAVLTDPSEIRTWSPVEFELDGLATPALEQGSNARIHGSLAGLRVGFDVSVHAADDDGLRLTAQGPVALDVTYGLRPSASGSEVSASVRIKRSSGITGRVVAKATEAMLAAGALEHATGRIARAAEALAAAPVAA